MANNEGVDIIIKATDQYTKTINNITASNDLFGKSIANTEKEIAAITKLMITMKVQGIEPTDAAMVKLKADYDRLTASLNSGEGAIKKTNMQYTNLALVIQDLPYGFRGIQNNLPALLGSIAGVGGAAYLAFSALIALYTAFGDQINDAILKTTNFEKAQRELGKSTIEAAKSTETARTEILKVTSVVQAARDGFVDKTAALQYYNDKLGDSFGKVTTLGEAEQALVDKAPKYVEALMLKAKAEFYFAKASEFAVKKDIAGLEDQTSALDKLLITANTIAKFGDVAGVKGIIKTLVEGIGQAQNEGVAKVTKTAGAIADVLTEEGKKSMSAYFKALKDSGLTDADIQSIIDKLNQKLLKTQVKGNQDRLKAVENANNAEIKAFTETLNERDKKEYEAGIKLAENLQTMRAAGYTDSTTYYTAYRAEMDRIDTYYNDKEVEQARKTSEKIAKDAEVLDNRQLQNSLDALKIESDVAMKIANLSGNANAADRIKILEDYKNSLYDLASVGGYTAEQYDRIDDAIRRVDGAIEGSKDKVKNYTVTWQETVNAINGILTNLDVSLLTNLGEQIGNMLAGGEFDISQMGAILADALSSIGKALIAFALTNGAAMELFKDPKTWPLALAAGIAAVAAGTALKAKISNNKTTAFANGGIVSGPTMGLVGEYPGAQNNPEVIAPLDKLKDMIGGGGGGTFVLRGQDLLLSVNRAQKASNLKGQNISLA